jgi:outer membrane immunogenic protein
MNKLSIMVKIIMITIGTIGIAYADNEFFHHSLLNSWTGFYVGANMGIAFNHPQIKSQQLGFSDPSNTCNADSNFSTSFPGIQLGYTQQFPNYFVSGIEANASLNTHQKHIFSCISAYDAHVYDQLSLRNQLQSSIKGRLGRTLSWNNNILLPYLTTGVSFAKIGLTYKNEGGDSYTRSTIAAGWLIGAGVEWVLNQNWSLRAEYSYIDYGNAISMNIPSVYDLGDAGGGARTNLFSNNFIVSINYWI